jgi:hypothetical protein
MRISARKVVFGPIAWPLTHLRSRQSARKPRDIAAAFAAIDVHDDTFEEVHFLPAKNRRVLPTLEVILYRHWEGTRRLLRFSRCANVELLVDTNTLFDNAPSNTSCFEATADRAAIEKVIRRHARSWNVSYKVSEVLTVEGASPKWWIHPLASELSAADRLVLFRIQLFGGVLSALAPGFTLKRVSDKVRR